MEAWMAFVSIMAIVAIVVVAGGLIAFIGHMIIGAFDSGKTAPRKDSKDVIDYAQYKQLTSGSELTNNQEYDFEAINKSKAEKEKAELESVKEDFYALDKDDELEEIEKRLKGLDSEKVNEDVKTETKEEIKEEIKEDIDFDDEDDFNLDNLLSEISNDVIEEEKSNTEEKMNIGSELDSYSIEDILKQVENDETEETVETVQEETEEEVKVEEPKVVEEEIKEEIAEEIKEEIAEEIKEEVKEEIIEEAVEEIVEPVVEAVKVEEDSKNAEIEALKAQLEELNKQLELARTAPIEVVKVDTTEEECVARIDTLEERLKNVKKDYKVNMKEYRPLKKVMNDLDRYQTKLRRKEAIVAKKKVALYGVNNYVDIDKEKAEKLANELELLDGLRLSVSHCEEVINANKDRFPILEHTNQILEDQIAHIEADLKEAQELLIKIRDKKGNGEGSQE